MTLAPPAIIFAHHYHKQNVRCCAFISSIIMADVWDPLVIDKLYFFWQHLQIHGLLWTTRTCITKHRHLGKFTKWRHHLTEVWLYLQSAFFFWAKLQTGSAKVNMVVPRKFVLSEVRHDSRTQKWQWTCLKMITVKKRHLCDVSTQLLSSCRSAFFLKCYWAAGLGRSCLTAPAWELNMSRQYTNSSSLAHMSYSCTCPTALELRTVKMVFNQFVRHIRKFVLSELWLNAVSLCSTLSNIHREMGWECGQSKTSWKCVEENDIAS